MNTAQSFAVDARMRQNRNDVRTYGIRSTPTIIVQGKWRVSPNGLSSYDEMIEVIDYLVDMEAEAMGLAESGESEQTEGDAEAAEEEQAEDVS